MLGVPTVPAEVIVVCNFDVCAGSACHCVVKALSSRLLVVAMRKHDAYWSTSPGVSGKLGWIACCQDADDSLSGCLTNLHVST